MTPEPPVASPDEPAPEPVLHPEWSGEDATELMAAPPFVASDQQVILHGTLPAEAARTYIYQDVLEEVLRHARNPQIHAGGLFLGERHLFSGAELLEINGFMAAGPTEHNTSLASRLNQAFLDAMVLEDTSVMGWFHCRPAPGPGPTPQDLLIHRSVFVMPWQVMLLLDTRSRQLALFQDVLEDSPYNTGFYILR